MKPLTMPRLTWIEHCKSENNIWLQYNKYGAYELNLIILKYTWNKVKLLNLLNLVKIYMNITVTSTYMYIVFA